MTHLFQLSLDTSLGDTAEFTRYLLTQGWGLDLHSVNQDINSQEQIIIIETPNKRVFEGYLRKKNALRDATDPHSMIKAWKYNGLKGKAAGSSKEGKLASTRVKKFLKEKRKK